MKQPIVFFIFFLTFFSYSQSKILKTTEGASLVNSGVMIDTDNSANGYYFFYEVDKVNKREREFAIKILDQNLNEVINKSFVEDRNSYLMQVKYNKQQLMFVMYNSKDFKFIFYSLDKDGNLNKVSEYEEGIKNYVYRSKSTVPTFSFYPIANKGFLLFMLYKNKKHGYKLKYISTNGGESWDYTSGKEQHEILQILNVDEKGIILQEVKKKRLLSGEYSAFIKILDPETGEAFFKKEYPQEAEIPEAWNNVFISNEEVIIIGEYWAEKERVFKDDSKGLFINKYNFEGNKTFNKRVSWQDNFEQTFNELNDESGRNYLFFHDFMTTENGHIYALAEQYRKTLRVGLGAQLTITDAYVLDFDKEFNLVDVIKFDKGKSRIKSSVVAANRHLLAMLLSREGGFDYEFTQTDKKKDRFYSLFLDYERLKGEKNKIAFKAIIYNDGKLTEDKIYLENDLVKTQVKAAKAGYVLLVDHDKKKKEVKLHLEKLNIE
ncbi:DUF6770 family protein [Flavivirga spongiicola]|uniref:BNR repeat neuraminidase n=1 Tax=Flavivirga spongiicola TaxID=421621 RepID=A0ABU7XWH0_9FLAO|nr:DUF6770 family protein [Flavivirga sp. MEBiC05379]MDO5980126.1 hypothetical protein [Flavivirga sp. MEBiC05379]